MPLTNEGTISNLHPSSRTCALEGIIPHPFDAAAPSYDADFTERRLGRWLREAVWNHLAATFHPGDHVLELGCGTGEDAIWLAQRGVRVHATDASPAMLTVAQRKASTADVGNSITFSEWNLNTPAPTSQEAALHNSINVQPEMLSFVAPSFAAPLYDGALSNFGVLNCLPTRQPLAETLAQSVRPGGHVVLVVMGPLCPWEWAWHLAHGQVRTAFRRFRSGVQAHVGEGQSVPVWYPTPRRLRREFAPHFDHLATIGIGSFLPPSYLTDLADRWPRLFSGLATLDSNLGRHFPFTWLNDHYLMILQRSSVTAP